MAALFVWHPWKSPDSDLVTSRSPLLATAPATEARQFTARARAITEGDSLSREQLDAANALCERALELDPTDALVWAEAARTDLLLIHPYGFDRSDERRRRAQMRASRAISLGPDAFEVRLVHASVIAHARATPALLREAETTLRELRAIQPDNQEVTVQLAEVLREASRFEEAAELFESVGEFEIAAWSYYIGGKPGLAMQSVEHALATTRTPSALQLKAMLLAEACENLPEAQATIEQLRPSELLNEMQAGAAARIYLFQRNGEMVSQIIRALPTDYLDSHAFRGPRHYFTGLAESIAGNTGRAQAEWRAGLALVESRLSNHPDNPELLLWAAWLQASLDRVDEAERLFSRAEQVGGFDLGPLDNQDVALKVMLRLGQDDLALGRLEQTFQTKRPMWEVFHAEARFSPLFDHLRGDPRLEQLLRDHLPEGAKPFADE